MLAAIPNASDVRELREANALLSRFASQAAHDIQEPLHLLAGYLDLIVAHHESGLEIDALGIARDARETAQRAQQLVASLLDFSRAAHTGSAPVLVPLDAALGDALANLTRLIKESRALVEGEALPSVLGERTDLARVFQNLIENSIKYASPERVPIVRIAAHPSPTSWVVTLDDNGPGWPRKGRDRLFQPFSRLHSEDGPAGAGLGLAMVRIILERHGGRVEASDAPGGGARVELHFPRLP